MAGYLIEERRRWPVITASPRGQCSQYPVYSEFWKERHIQMRPQAGKTVPVTWSDEKLILLYCPGRGSNSRPSAHRGFKHGQGVPCPYSLGHGGGMTYKTNRNKPSLHGLLPLHIASMSMRKTARIGYGRHRQF